jgi:hypothetical protein
MPVWMLQWVASRGEKDGYSKLMLTAPLMGIIAVKIVMTAKIVCAPEEFGKGRICWPPLTG